MNYRVLLYYKFVEISDPIRIRDAHQKFCLNAGLKGRVIFAKEGVNGTISGSAEAIEQYKLYMESYNEFKGMEWKQDQVEVCPFAKMQSKVKRFLVSFGEGNEIDLKEYKAHYLQPSEWRKVIETEDDCVVLDVRNTYEAKVGRFKGAVVPKYENFHDFPKWAQELSEYKDKKILMYCTGGIRCEKFSALLVKEGFKDVYQLHGGIINYVHKEQGAHFDGSCFVFDDRLRVPIQKESKPISSCEVCGTPEDKFLNCANMDCNKLFICCDECAQKLKGICSDSCDIAERRRPFDPIHFRIPFRKKGHVFPELGIAKNKNELNKG